MIKITEKIDCCGCEACANICAQHAITMQEDNEGFLYPWVDATRCNNCDLCQKVCPILTPEKSSIKVQDAYVAQHISDEVRYESSSGGAFTAIAEYVIKEGGVVFGAAFNKDFQVEHQFITKLEEIGKFRGSKYVQSQINNSYKEVESFLKKGRMVCFSGTPCQVEGLLHYLRKSYDKLITVDFVCHGVPSPKVWRKYLTMIQKKYQSSINKLSFRGKGLGYVGVMTIHFLNGKLYQRGTESDAMLKLFFSEMINRPSCHKCAFRNINYRSDFTIFDAWRIRFLYPPMADDKGTTSLLVHTEKGQILIGKLATLRIVKLDFDKVIKFGTGTEMPASPKPNPLRDDFFKENSLSFDKLLKKYVPLSTKDKIKMRIKPLFYKLGLYKVLRDIKMQTKYK